ncbi:MAG TPA: serine/threonine-protein kinase [Ktedonobacterales bacterium]|nr:serine/threonine-protein kinase [Ktedonobacterales bacterium]
MKGHRWQSARLADPWLAQPLEGRYALRRVVAEGPVTRVYCGADLLVGDAVAVKRILAPELSARFLWRFRVTAARMAMSDLLHCVAVRDYALIDHDALIVMDWQPTPTLGAHLQAHGRLPVKISSQLALWLAEALAELHRHDLLHLGLTPNNIFLDRSVGVKVADAGLARVIADTGLTMTGGNLARALPYLAPEQLTYSALSPATDVYAFGAILFQTLTGVSPFPQQTVAEYAMLASQRQQESPRPSQHGIGIPPALDDVIAACLNHDPQWRPQDGMALAEQLRMASDASLADVATAQMYVTHVTTQHRALAIKHPSRRRQRTMTSGQRRTT